MTNFHLYAIFLLLAVLLHSSTTEEDFGFDSSDDLEVEFEEQTATTDTKWNDGELTAYVGRGFRLKVPRKENDGEEFEVKRHGSGKGLPSWLLFNKNTGIFWGVPLSQDVGLLHLTLRSVKTENIEEIKIKVVEDNQDPPGIEKCSKNEDNTVLILLLDKNLRVTKPKQRVVAINNIAKFFGLPYSAFTLQTQLHQDDIMDKSVILAGPGNIKNRTSKSSSILRVQVGCSGRLWLSTTSLINQLKSQARDGTIAEVLGISLIGWRVKKETKSDRTKREVSGGEDDYGSGDYNDEDEYYDDYEDYEGELGDTEKSPPVPKDPISLPTHKKSSTTSTTTASSIDEYEDYEGEIDVEKGEEDEDIILPSSSTTTSTTESTMHPHRHHHGELNPSITSARDHHTTHKITSTEHIVTTPSTTSTTVISSTSSVNTPKSISPDDILNYEDNYDYGDYADENEEAIESETVIPDLTSKKKQTVTPAFEDTESITTEETTTKTTIKDFIVSEIPPSSTTITSTTTSTTPPPTTIVTSTSTTTTSTTTVAPITTISSTSTVDDNIVSTNGTTSTSELPTTILIDDIESEEISTIETEKPTTVADITTQQQTVIPTVLTTTTTTEAPVTDIDEDDDGEETTVKVTTVRHVPSTTPSTTTTIREVTEIEHHENFEPFIENRLKQMSVIAGKIFRFVIPHNTFKDHEDGYDLTYQLLDSDNRTVTNNTWLHFNPARREIYGLPLEEDVSKWVFWVKAHDKDGRSVQEKLNIQVQQHKLDLVVNHEFSLQIRIEKQQEFPHYVDWSLKIFRALGRIYNTNMSEITVRKIDYSKEPVIFTWSNDSIPTNYCPKTEIIELYKTLTANDRGDPSRELNMALSPELRVKKVLYRELGVCEPAQTPVTPPTNFSPILRNPVDHVNATVGELLIYKVKDDTFYDPEDVDPRMLNISLLTADRKPIPPDNWLQFDSKNREFYGVPRKPGRSEYQLVCVDSGGLPATDSLEVIVYPFPKRHYNVEFSMNITEVPFKTFVNSATLQKKFVEKLMALFGESTPSSIHLLPFKQTYDSTIVTWYNKSLPTTRCPHEEIKRLETVLHNMNDKSISHKVHAIMEPEFRVSTIKVHPMGSCKPRPTHDPRPEISVPIDETASPSSGDEYVVTFVVPAVIIAVMLFLAAVAAIVLYRRRRMGKMNVEEDGRASYGNKGIPVIFQEELEEKPEPGTKAPVILKDEKPPLAPPEYSKSGSVKLSDDSEPYQPPPPFTRSREDGRQQRPKATPTYRKPPPYVPP